MKSVSYLLAAGAALTLSLGTLQSAKADPTSNTFQFIDGGDSNSVSVAFGGTTENVIAGAYDIKIDGIARLGFCTAINLGVDNTLVNGAALWSDITTSPLASTVTYNKDTSATVGGHSRFDNAKAVAYVTSKYLHSSDKNDREYAALAIWNIIDNGTTTIDASDNDFKINDDTARSHAQTIVTAAYADTTGALISWEQTPKDGSKYQDFAVDPIPEPAFYQMGAFLTGGGLLALRLRKRK